MAVELIGTEIEETTKNISFRRDEIVALELSYCNYT